MYSAATAFVVDDDEDTLKVVSAMLAALNCKIETFVSGEDFLARDLSNFQFPGCILLDILMPGLSGLEVMLSLRDAGIRIPIIGMSASSDATLAVQAMKFGAFDFIEKPLHRQLILERVENALQEDKKRRLASNNASQIQTHLKQLSSRERDVYQLLLHGKSSKEIAGILGIGLPTVTKHRASVFRKMGVGNAVELVRQSAVLRPAANGGTGA